MNVSFIADTRHQIAQFRRQVTTPFSLKELDNVNYPIVAAQCYTFTDFPDVRVNHYLIKKKHSLEFVYGVLQSHEEISSFVRFCKDYCTAHRLPIQDRYCYLTVDQGTIRQGETLRTPGWHVDGLQGDEVPIKQDADFQFVWSDALPTEFTSQPFDLSAVDLSRHNLFLTLEALVRPELTYTPPSRSIVLMNPYHVHRATRAHEEMYRRFVRLSFSYVPVTSKRMTLNEEIDFDYLVHSTSGEIPSHLTVAPVCAKSDFSSASLLVGVGGSHE